MTRIHNPITSRALSNKYVGIGTEVFQIAFIIIATNTNKRNKKKSSAGYQKEVTR